MVIFINTFAEVPNDAKQEGDANMNRNKCKIEGVGMTHRFVEAPIAFLHIPLKGTHFRVLYFLALMFFSS